MGVAVTPEAARAALAAFEAQCGYQLGSMAPEVRDNWDKKLTVMFAELGVDVTDQAQAAAAFAGAWLILSGLIPGSYMPIGNMQTAVAIARGAADHADTSEMLAELDTWLKNQ